LGEDLVLSARSPDGVVEGIEMPRGKRRFVVGVQWHPESFWDHPPGFGPLFEALVRAANGRAR
jgi:putative glutamine amidotransferase